MTKAEYIDFIRNSLHKMDQTAKYHQNQVAFAIEKAFNTVFYDMYALNPKSLDRYAKQKTGIVSLDVSTNRLYTPLTTPYVDLPGKGSGILNINTTTGRTLKFVPMNEYEMEQISGLDASLPKNVIGYSVQPDRIEYYNLYSTSGVTASDWFLPSIDELDAMYTNLYLNNLGGFETSTGNQYCSSTEIDASTCMTKNFGSGGPAYGDSKGAYFFIRACRTFIGGTYAVGDIGPSGGYVFYDDGGTYYEAYPTDSQDGTISWSNINNVEIGVTSQGSAIGTGVDNTAAIIAQVGQTNSAAKTCDALVSSGSSLRILQVIPFSEYVATDEVLVPHGQDQKVMDLVRQFLGATPPVNTVNDNSDANGQ